MNNEFNLENTIGYMVNRCAILLRNELTYRFKQTGFDITPEEWVILSRLWEKNGLSQNDLAERTIKDKTTVTRFLNQMEVKQLVIRKPSQQDRRSKNVFLTSNAQKIIPSLIQIVKGLLEQVASDSPEADIRTTLNFLKTIEGKLLDMERL